MALALSRCSWWLLPPLVSHPSGTSHHVSCLPFGPLSVLVWSHGLQLWSEGEMVSQLLREVCRAVNLNLSLAAFVPVLQPPSALMPKRIRFSFCQQDLGCLCSGLEVENSTCSAVLSSVAQPCGKYPVSPTSPFSPQHCKRI